MNERLNERLSEKWTMTLEEAAAALGISRATSYKLAHTGEIPTIRLGRQLKVPIVQLERLLNEKQITPPESK